MHLAALSQHWALSNAGVPPQARIYDNETDRDRTTLKKNLPIQIHLDVTGSQPCGDSSQLPLSQEADQHRQEV